MQLKSMAKFKENQKVWLPERKKFGKIKGVDAYGQPLSVEIDGQIEDSVNLVIEVLTLFKKLWLAIRGIFGDDKTRT